MVPRCRVCDGEIAPDEMDEYSVHPECMPAYREQACAILRRYRQRHRAVGWDRV